MANVDQRLADWMEAYRNLKDAQALLQKQGPKPTLEIREEVARLQRKAELALKALTEEFEAAKLPKDSTAPEEPNSEGQ